MTANSRLIWAMLLSLWTFARVIRSEFSNRVPGPWFQYNFLRGECLGGEISPSSVSAYNWFSTLDIANTDTIQCANGTGIMGTSINPTMERVISSGASGNELLDLMHNSATGLSFEIWFDPADSVPSDENNVILAITLSDPDNAPNNARNVIKIVENGNRYKLLFDFETGGFQPYFLDVAEKPTSSHQFVYTIEYNYVGKPECASLPSPASCQLHVVYINGVLMNELFVVVTSGFPPYSPEKIHLFSDPVNLPTYAPSLGTIYMIAMYGYPLDEADILQNYEAKLVNSAPVAFDSKLIVPEDREIGDNYDDPESYVNPIPGSECFVIVIEDYIDADEDPERPNYNNDDSPATLFITSLPKGDIFDFYGNPITEDDLPYTVSLDDDNSLRYRPLWNEWSGLDKIYTSFEYIYKDGVDPLLESNIGTASIYVIPKNDQPIAVAGDSVVIRGVASEVCVEAYDEDDGDNVAGIVLVDAPQHGTLYQLDSSGTADIEKPLSSGDSFDNLLCAAYLYTGDDLIPTDGIMGFDTLTFKAYDTATITGYSLEATTTLNIYEGLLAGNGTTSTISFDVIEDAVNSITIYGSDAVQTGRTISFVISTPPTYGILIDASTEEPINYKGESLTTTLTSPYIGGIEVQYLPLDNYFSADLPDNFSYYVAATDDIEIKSKEVLVTMNVINVNDPMEISCPESYYSTPSSDETVHQVTFSDFDMNDADLNVDMVRMVITAFYGTLTLNEEDVNYVDFASPDICFGQEKWTCKGSGSGDYSMSFVGYPSDILKAIIGLKYVAVETGKVDKISLTVYDGAGDECISNPDHEGSSTVRTECFTSTCNLQVLISPQGSNGGDGDAGDTGDISAASTGFKMSNFPLYMWLLIFGASAICCCFCVKRTFCHSRAPQVQYLPSPPYQYTAPLPSPQLQSPKELPTMENKTKGNQDHQPMKNNNFDMDFYDHSKKVCNTTAPTECPSPSSQSDTPLKKVRSNSYAA